VIVLYDLADQYEFSLHTIEGLTTYAQKI